MDKKCRPYDPGLLKLISILLLYPDDEFMDSLGLLETEMNHLRKESVKERMVSFISRIKNMPAIELQEHYTQVFDVNPDTCLNLTYHSTGDSKDRGRLLAQLDQLYLDSGYERTVSELPDYLPLVLEFLSQCQKGLNSDLLRRQLRSVNGIAEALRKTGSPYQLLMEILTAENYARG